MEANGTKVGVWAVHWCWQGQFHCLLEQGHQMVLHNVQVCLTQNHMRAAVLGDTTFCWKHTASIHAWLTFLLHRHHCTRWCITIIVRNTALQENCTTHILQSHGHFFWPQGCGHLHICGTHLLMPAHLLCPQLCPPCLGVGCMGVGCFFVPQGCPASAKLAALEKLWMGRFWRAVMPPARAAGALARGAHCCFCLCMAPITMLRCMAHCGGD